MIIVKLLRIVDSERICCGFATFADPPDHLVCGFAEAQGFTKVVILVQCIRYYLGQETQFQATTGSESNSSCFNDL